MVFIRAEVKRGLALEHPSQAASNLAGFFFFALGRNPANRGLLPTVKIAVTICLVLLTDIDSVLA